MDSFNFVLRTLRVRAQQHEQLQLGLGVVLQESEIKVDI